MSNHIKHAGHYLSFSVVKTNDSKYSPASSKEDSSTILAIANRLVPVLDQENIYYDKKTETYYKSLIEQETASSCTITFFDVTDIHKLLKSYQQKSEFLKVDETTGLIVKRELYYLMQLYLTEVYPFTEEFSILVFDLDNFKKVNDIYGHHQGDICLRLVAKTLQEAIRGNDIIGRIGGEEFAILLKNVSKDKSFQLAEKFREKVSHCSCEIPITTSIGVLHSSDIVITKLNKDFINEALCDYYIDLADQALYTSKKEGKNRTTFYRNKS